MLFRSISLAALGLLLTAGLASAHAQFQSSTPPASGTVTTLPDTLQATYSEELSSIRFDITGPNRVSATGGDPKIDLEHRTSASVPLKNVGPGVYTVVWHNVSGDDGDPNDGAFTFTLAGAPAPTTAATPGAAATPQPAPAPAVAPAAAVPATGDDAITRGISDVRLNTYRKRQAIRDQYRGKIIEVVFNEAVADNEGLETALADAMKG
jgi:methionine-rich copper-binding protein CopC